ncbi:hypothetical protein M422DRAFT_240127 [Sphaerobolus stellatus SS14]|nr:hypothetical protein M422DRAFT_240127 [Sphaerobolus stellatus SS14]
MADFTIIQNMEEIAQVNVDSETGIPPTSITITTDVPTSITITTDVPTSITIITDGHVITTDGHLSTETTIIATHSVVATVVPNPAASASGTHVINHGPIIGGICGTIALAVLLFFFLIFRYRRNKARSIGSEPELARPYTIKEGSRRGLGRAVSPLAQYTIVPAQLNSARPTDLSPEMALQDEEKGNMAITHHKKYIGGEIVNQRDPSPSNVNGTGYTVSGFTPTVNLNQAPERNNANDIEAVVTRVLENLASRNLLLRGAGPGESENRRHEQEAYTERLPSSYGGSQHSAPPAYDD